MRRETAESPWILYALTAAFILSSANKSVLNVLASSVQASLSLTDIEISLAQGGAFAFSYVLAGLAVGFISDRGHRKMLLVGGILFWSLASALIAAATSFNVLLLCRVLLGIGESVILPVGLSIIVNVAPKEKRARWIGIFLSGGYVGLGLSTFIGGVGLDAFKSVGAQINMDPWRLVFLVLATIGIPVAFACSRIKSTAADDTSAATSDESGTNKPSQPSEYQSWAIFMTIVVAMTLSNLAEYAISARLPTLLERDYFLTHTQIGTSLGLIAIILGGLGTGLGGWLTDSLTLAGPHRNKARAGAILFFVCIPFAGFGLATQVVLVLVGYAAFAFVVNAAGSAALSAAQDAVPASRRGVGTAMQSLCFTAIGLGLGPTIGALNPAIIGSHANQLGIWLSVVSMPTMLLISIILCVVAIKISSKSQKPAVGGLAHGNARS